MIPKASTQPLAASLSHVYVQAKGSDLRVHFKNTREAAMAIKNMELVKAKDYLQAVLEHKRVIPFRSACRSWLGQMLTQHSGPPVADITCTP